MTLHMHTYNAEKDTHIHAQTHSGKGYWKEAIIGQNTELKNKFWRQGEKGSDGEQQEEHSKIVHQTSTKTNKH